MTQRDLLRFKWDHRHPAHRAAVRAANHLLASVPLGLKYRAGAWLRMGRPPYSLIGPGDVVVQVGAPSDTLHSGRSRGMHMALKSTSGHAIIVEPDPASAEEFRKAAVELGLDHVTVVNAGAWRENSTMTLLVDPRHPATNFLDGQVPYSDERRRDFVEVTVPVRTLDDIVQEVTGSCGPVRLVSITTNNSELEITEGMHGVVSSGLKYVSLARTGPGYHDAMKHLGFDYLANDDRGYTYLRHEGQGTERPPVTE